MIGRAAVPFGARRATVVRPGCRPAPRTGPPRPRPPAWASAWASASAYASCRRGAWRRAGIHPGARASRTGPGRVGPWRGSTPGRSRPRARRSATRARSWARPARQRGRAPEPGRSRYGGRGAAARGRRTANRAVAKPGPSADPAAERGTDCRARAGRLGRAARGGGGCRRGTTSGLGRGRDHGGRRLNDRRVCGRHGRAVPSLLLWDKRMARAGRARGLGVCDAVGPSGPSDSPWRAARTGARGCGGWDRRGADRPGCCRARGRRPSVRGGAAAPGGWPGP